MKRLIIPGLALLAIAALAISGNLLVARALDSLLPQLLTRELGIPVTLSRTRAHVATLTVHTPRLVMGDPARPALTATRVAVSLDWSDLLRGEIRLRRASGDELMVKPSLWPGNDNPWPTDYRFLDPYLPDHIRLEKARYVDADDDNYTFIQPLWRRQPPGAALTWRDEQSSQALDIDLGLASLDQLLRLAEMKLNITTTAAGQAESTVESKLEIQPGESSGYTLSASITGAGMTADVTSGSSGAWQLPNQSSTSIKLLDLKKLQALVKRYSATKKTADPEAMLGLALPRLALPEHKGHITINEMRWQDEVVTNTAVDFITGAKGVNIPTVSSSGPEGVLHGQLNITSAETGWQLELEADLKVAETDKSLASPYLDADWFWREGNARVSGTGATWGALLNSLQGDIALSGSHRGALETPVSITAKLGNRPGEFALDKIDIKVGNGHITGSATLSGGEQKRLSGKISADQTNFDFLLPEPGTETLPGIAIPNYLTALPGVDLDWQADLNALTVSGLKIDRTQIAFARTPEKTLLTAQSSSDDGALVNLKLDANSAKGKLTQVTLRTDFSELSISKLFQQAPMAQHSRTSGTISFTGSGNDVQQIFESMQGKASLTIDHRFDRDWKRPAIPKDQLTIAGDATLVIDKNRITGLQVSQLAIDSVLQNLTGTLSIVEGRKPWLEAKLTSDQLDLDRLSELRSQDASAATPSGADSDSLDSLRELGDSRLSLVAKKLIIAGQPLSGVSVKLETAPGDVKIEQLDFSLDKGRLTSSGGISWAKEEATFTLDAKADEIRLDKLLTNVPAEASQPLSGTISLHSKGDSVGGLLAGLTGDIQLATKPGSNSTTSDPGGRINMTARQTADGMQADIHQFEWNGTNLSGSVHYRNTTPPLWEAEINGGSLSLLPWQTDESKQAKDASKKSDESIIGTTARASVDLLGNVVMAPIRLVSGPREAKPGEKIFSKTALPFELLNNYQASIKGKLDALSSREATASDLEFSLKLMAGEMTFEGSAAKFNEGSASVNFKLDTTQTPAAMQLIGTFKDMRGELIKASFPRSGHFNVSSHGGSQAEIAGNVSGMVYLDLGAGTLDYSSLILLTADVGTAMFETLIPGADKKPPELQCGLTLGVFKNGLGTTPYGYAARTDLANLVGKVEIDLKKELIHASFSSSSRQGIGISVGNVFSNTVEVEGPISDPKVIPNATGLLWRSWAAIMTGGLSIVGESMLKRALASDNPCDSVRKHILKDFCGTDAAADASPMVCPAA